MAEYAKRDIRALDRQGNYYSRHVNAMTGEDLHAKSDIAAELAWRDARIDALAAHLERLPALLDKLTHNLIQMQRCKHQHQIRAAIEVFETDIYEIRHETPETSLARRDAEKQAAAVTAFAQEVWEELLRSYRSVRIMPLTMARQWIESRQAEDHPPYST